MKINMIPERQVRAFYTKDFIRVYQAYPDSIADSALEKGTFVSPPFSMARMTWIKPSFLWMMYRSGWGMKESGQKRILAVDLTHEGFNSLIRQASVNECLNKNGNETSNRIKNSDVIIQWDPERDIFLNKLSYRTIQIGLRNDAVEEYCNKWIYNITDITGLCQEIYGLVNIGDIFSAQGLLPIESDYNGSFPDLTSL